MCEKSRIAICVVLVLCVSVSQAQTPATEQDWRVAREQASKEYGTAKANFWGGIVLTGLGAPLTIYGAGHRKECIQGPGGLARLLDPNACDVYAGKADWRIMGPGLGALGGGMFVVIHSAQTKHRKAERLKELDEIRQQHGWTVSVNSTALTLGYRW